MAACPLTSETLESRVRRRMMDVPLTSSVIAKALGISERSVQRLAAQGMPHDRFNRNRLFTLRVVLDWLTPRTYMLDGTREGVTPQMNKGSARRGRPATRA